MSDDTATTAEVRRAWTDWNDLTGANPPEAFDRWLAGIVREAKAEGFDHAVSIVQYEDGTPVELVEVVNPFRGGVA